MFSTKMGIISDQANTDLKKSNAWVPSHKNLYWQKQLTQILVKDNTTFDSQVIPPIHKSIDEWGVGKKKVSKKNSIF